MSNVQLGNIVDNGFDSSYAYVSFDVDWENSWRLTSGSSNWDVVWLFVKWSKDGGTTWKHASLDNSSHVAPTGMTITTGLVDPDTSFHPADNPGVGVFLFRSSAGVGPISATGVQLRWNYPLDGVLTSDNVQLQIHALEMVFIPEGAFFAGDTSSPASFRQGAGDSDPWQITGEGVINVTNVASNGYYYQTDLAGSDEATGATFPIPASFPKGYRAFYAMKYELSQAGWIAFFNTLTGVWSFNPADLSHLACACLL